MYIKGDLRFFCQIYVFQCITDLQYISVQYLKVFFPMFITFTCNQWKKLSFNSCMLWIDVAYLKLYEHFNQVINEEVFVTFVIVTLFHYFLHNLYIFSFSACKKRS